MNVASKLFLSCLFCLLCLAVVAPVSAQERINLLDRNKNKDSLRRQKTTVNNSDLAREITQEMRKLVDPEPKKQEPPNLYRTELLCGIAFFIGIAIATTGFVVRQKRQQKQGRPAPESSPNIAMIISAITAVAGLMLLLYSNSLNYSLEAQLISMADLLSRFVEINDGVNADNRGQRISFNFMPFRFSFSIFIFFTIEDAIRAAIVRLRFYIP